ncbi:MAG: DUF983 domain-containing protein [Bacteroidetes bacterium]|nr:MAG: DUF983 domain-containing protein [Bacteroidota bacterium]
MPEKKKSILKSILTCRCPRCHEGAMFLNANPYNLLQIEKMPPECPACGQDFVIEPGFFFGSTYISYALNVAWMIPSFLLLHFGLGVSLYHYWFFFAVTLLLLAPLIFRLSRSAWMHAFVRSNT